ncbi:LrgB family protein [Nitrosomonas sp. Nm33]|uniref:LrgB family protein n=1 Tax=Nitrosomonas sp. Nm33 TaxID=133724 RepID=UPI00089A1A6A|nr:LrgB family protein [Nitrosomonas sp. Nm33]SDZ11262.1 Putative effector of murein hydrolase [Nitrosomonas sp. Nm33]
MNPDQLQIAEIWVYLSGSPLFALIITLTAYQAGILFYEKANKNPLANPVAIAVVLVAIALYLVGMPYQRYFEGAQFVHFLLGTATVALAVPIYRSFAILKTRLIPLTIALLCGGAVSIASAVGISTFLGADTAIIGAFYPKSVTAPIAMGIAERVGVSPTLTAVFAIVTGILGAILGSSILNLLGMRAWWQRGFAMGVAAHGIGTSRAFAVHPEAGVYASLAMGMHGILGAILIPLLVSYIR